MWKDEPKRYVETIEKPKVDISFKDKKRYNKTFRGLLESCLKNTEKDNNHEMTVFIKWLIEEYDKHERVKEIPIESWRGKSSLEIIWSPTKVVAIKWRKPNKDSEAKQIRTEINKAELISMVNAVRATNFGFAIETKFVAGEYFKSLNITSDEKGNELYDENGGFKWDVLFNWRSMHNKITIILDVLDEEGFIHYSGGKIQIVNEGFDINKTFK